MDITIFCIGHSDLPCGFHGAKCIFYVFAIIILILYQVQLKGFSFQPRPCGTVGLKGWLVTRRLQDQVQIVTTSKFLYYFLLFTFFLVLTKGNMPKPPGSAAYKNSIQFFAP